MLGSTSIPPVPHGIKNLMTGLSSIAGRWGSSLIAYEIHPNLEGVEIGPMVYKSIQRRNRPCNRDAVEAYDARACCSL